MQGESQVTEQWDIRGIFHVRQYNCYYVIVEQALVPSTVVDRYAEIWTTSNLSQPQNTRTKCSDPRGTYLCGL